MVVDPKTITLYTLVHDWWGVAVTIVAGYKLWHWVTGFKTDLTSFKVDVQSDINQAKTEMLANTTAIKHGLEQQTTSIVNELRELRQDFRMALIPPRPARASRAKKIVIDASADVY